MDVSLSVLGAGGVGKSALTIQYVFNRYEPDYDPTIEDMYKRQQEVDGKSCMLSVLDTAGQEEFFAMRDSWIRNGDCFVLVYSITSRASFEELKQIYEAVHRVKDKDEGTGEVAIVLVGNKSDLASEREVSREEGEALAAKWKCAHFESSAKSRVNVIEPFHEAVRACRKLRESQVPPTKGGKGTLATKKWASMCSIM